MSSDAPTTSSAATQALPEEHPAFRVYRPPQDTPDAGPCECGSISDRMNVAHNHGMLR